MPVDRSLLDDRNFFKSNRKSVSELNKFLPCEFVIYFSNFSISWNFILSLLKSRSNRKRHFCDRFDSRRKWDCQMNHVYSSKAIEPKHRNVDFGERLFFIYYITIAVIIYIQYTLYVYIALFYSVTSQSDLVSWYLYLILYI